MEIAYRNLETAIKSLLNSSGLTNPIAEVVELGTAHFTTAHDLDIRNEGRVQQKDPLHTHTLENATHGNGGVETLAAHGNHNPLVGLDPLLITFLNAHPNPNRIAGIDGGEVVLEMFRFNFADKFLAFHRKRFNRVTVTVSAAVEGIQSPYTQGQNLREMDRWDSVDGLEGAFQPYKKPTEDHPIGKWTFGKWGRGSKPPSGCRLIRP